MKLRICFLAVRLEVKNSVCAAVRKRQSQCGQAGLGDALVLFFAATRHTDGAYALAVIDDGQAAAKGDKAGPQHDAVTHRRRMALQGFCPLVRGQAKADGRIGLVDGNVHRMQGRARHAQKGGQQAASVHHRDIDASAHVLCSLHGRTCGRVGSAPVDAAQADAHGSRGGVRWAAHAQRNFTNVKRSRLPLGSAPVPAWAWYSW